MKKRKLLPALLLVLCFALSACGSAGLASDSSTAAGGNRAPQASSAPEAIMPEPMPEAPMEYDGVAGESSFGSGGGYYDNTKIIRTADLSLQSTEFDTAVEALDALVKAQNGYYESSDFSFGGYSGDGNRRADFTIRVPKEHFDTFLSAVGDVAHVVSRNTGVQDVGEAYYDAELHLTTLETKHERLLTLLERAEVMEDIIALESALSDVEYQIQQYKSTLTRYDGLIDFSTIYLSLREVTRVADSVTEIDPLSARMGAAFSRGWHSFCDGMADFAVWCAYNFIGILIFLIFIAVVVAVLVRLRARRRQRKTLPVQPPEEDSK